MAAPENLSDGWEAIWAPWWINSTTDYSIFALSGDGRVVSWNVGGERIYGYSRDQILGSPLSIFYTEETIFSAW